MSHKFLTPVDFSKLEAISLRFQNLSTPPSSPALGQVYIDTDDNLPYFWNGSAWTSFGSMSAAAILAALITVDGTGSLLDADFLDGQSSAFYLARANHTGTQLAATVSDFDTQVRTSRLDQMAAPTADVSFNSRKITSLLTPTATTDAATKGYVDAAAAGIDWKASVRAATTAAGTLASSFENGDAIDGVTLATGDRILIKDQAAGAENGLYTVNASGAPTRATDADVNAEVTGGMAVFVEEGTINADTGWLMTNNGVVTVGTTALVFVQFTSLGQITAGAALTKTGSTLDVAVDGTTIEVNADALRVKDGGITDAKMDAPRTKKFSASVGDGSTTALVVTHNLNTRDVAVEVYDLTTFDSVLTDVVRTSVNVVTVTFAVAPTTNQYRVVVIG